MTVEIVFGDLEKALSVDSQRRILKIVGLMVTSDAQANFDRQEFDGESWERKYPNQTPFGINVAGVVADLSEGKSIKSSHFLGAPVLQDTGRLRNSISHRIVANDVVEVGSDAPYANLQQQGGESRQPITDRVKVGVENFLGTARGKDFRDLLGPLLNKDELVTEIVGRQFIGLTRDLEKDVRDLVEQEMEQGS